MFIDDQDTFLLGGLLLDRYPGTPTDVVEPALTGVGVGHAGGSWGANSQLTIYLEPGYMIVAVPNHRIGASPLLKRIEQLIERTR